jgi:hypothetical protein
MQLSEVNQSIKEIYAGYTKNTKTPTTGHGMHWLNNSK